MLSLVKVKDIPRKCWPIIPESANIQYIDKTFNEMIDLCEQSNGLGLAACQVGIALEMIVIKKPKKYLKILNPVYFPIGSEMVESTEGCPSLPDRLFIVKRFSRVQATGILVLDSLINPSKNYWDELAGLDAIVWQHEREHCLGLLISEIGIEYDRGDKNSGILP